MRSYRWWPLRRTLPSGVGLVEACDDPNLFNLPLWEGQRKLLAAYEQALAMGDWLAVWRLGRRSGKSTLAAIVALWCCLLREDLDPLTIAGRSQAVVITPTIRNSRYVVQVASDIVRRSPLLHELVGRKTRDEIEFTNGTLFTAFPASSRADRGWPFRCLILDDAAYFFANEVRSAHKIEEVYLDACLSLAQFQGRAPVIISSTPEGDANWFGVQVQKAARGELKAGRLYAPADVKEGVVQ